MFVLVDVNRERLPADYVGTKVSQVCLVDPVWPGKQENQAKALRASKANVVCLVMTASQVMKEFQELLAAQVRGSCLPSTLNILKMWLHISASRLYVSAAICPDSLY